MEFVPAHRENRGQHALDSPSQRIRTVGPVQNHESGRFATRLFEICRPHPFMEIDRLRLQTIEPTGPFRRAPQPDAGIEIQEEHTPRTNAPGDMIVDAAHRLDTETASTSLIRDRRFAESIREDDRPPLECRKNALGYELGSRRHVQAQLRPRGNLGSFGIEQQRANAFGKSGAARFAHADALEAARLDPFGRSRDLRRLPAPFDSFERKEESPNVAMVH